ncbi:(2Fe-2S)-binding protein [Thiosocius teredinicola]|uniref:(2Fe-2S)-binding protein n=1 Tax=Thiosocius teredinicola TaxID=1973002 RepID=UPI000991027E
MYVCVCNAVNDRQVKQALCEGKTTLREVRQHLGFRTCCGRCTSHMRDMVCQHRDGKTC